MRIQVKSEGHPISIPIPTGLIFSRHSVWLWLKIAKRTANRNDKYLPDSVEISFEELLFGLSEKQMYALCDEIMRIRRSRGEWKLVEVKTSSGEEVVITL